MISLREGCALHVAMYMHRRLFKLERTSLMIFPDKSYFVEPSTKKTTPKNRPNAPPPPEESNFRFQFETGVVMWGGENQYLQPEYRPVFTSLENNIYSNNK